MARSRGQSQPIPGWAWLLAGLGIGLLVAAAVYVRDDLPKLKFSNNSAPTEQATSKDTREVRNSTQKTIPAPKKTPYSFYEILPEMEVAIPEAELSDIENNKPRPQNTPEQFVMQVGSFTQFKDADRMKASLALLGLQATIESVNMADNTARHRVRLGPYKDFQRLSDARKQLRKNNIDLILLKIKNE